MRVEWAGWRRGGEVYIGASVCECMVVLITRNKCRLSLQSARLLLLARCKVLPLPHRSYDTFSALQSLAPLAADSLSAMNSLAEPILLLSSDLTLRKHPVGQTDMLMRTRF